METATSGDANPNPPLPIDRAQSREEGELPSSDDEDRPNFIEAHTIDTVAESPAPMEPFSSATENQHSGAIKTGNAISVINHASSIGVHSKTSELPNDHRGLGRLPVKSGRSVQFGNRGTNSNLVITLGGEHDSDSEDSRDGNVSGDNGKIIGATNNIKPPAPAQKMSKILHPASRNKIKTNPRRPSLSYTFVSNKSHRKNSWNAGSSSAGGGNQLKNTYTISTNKSFASHRQASNNELQDLRQQIAMRENELKLKSAQQSKDTLPSSCKDHSVMNPNNDAAGKTRATSTNIEQPDPKEPDRKRLKVNDAYSSQLNLDGHQDIATSKLAPTVKEPGKRKDIKLNETYSNQMNLDVHQEIPISRFSLAIREPVDENFGLQDENIVAYSTHKKDVPARLTSLSTVNLKKQDGKPVSSSAGSLPCSQKDGVNMIASHYHSEKNSRLPEPLIQSANVASRTLSRKSVPLNPPALWNNLDEVNVSGSSNIGVQSLEEIDEMQERELKDAQEHRCRCEIEERDALKAYRKAQRALIEANSRCNYLYRKRELYSAQFQSLIMEDSSLLWPSGQQDHIGIGLNSSNNVSEVNAALIPLVNPEMRGDHDIYNHPAGNSTFQFAEAARLSTCDRNVNGQNMGYEAGSELDVSTSEILLQKVGTVVNGACSPSNGQNISIAEEEDALCSGYKSDKPNLEFLRNEKNYKEKEKDINNESKIRLSSDSPQGSLLLEASLRSELFARLGKRPLRNGDLSQCVEPVVEKGAENDDGSEQSQMSRDNESFEEENNQHSDHGEGSKLSMSDVHPSPTLISVSPILMSAFSQIKVKPTISFNRTCEGKRGETSVSRHVGGNKASFNEIQSNDSRVNAYQETASNTSIGDNDSLTSDIAIDPFWPLCMYELRGKCNDEECPWQHVKDCCSRSTRVSNSTDSQMESLSLREKLNKVATCALAPPTYLVSSNNLKADLNAYEPVVAKSIRPFWQKCFITSLTVPSLLQRDVLSEGPYMHERDGFVEDGAWNRLPLYFQKRNDRVELKEGLVDSDQTLETVFHALNHYDNKEVGIKQALATLSRALEVDPTSINLWVVYLHIFYSYKKSIGKHDMFSYAIKHNEGCYKLWLMYINSRMRLDDRMVAYHTALSVLCRHASASASVVMHASACILDLFLQMMDCFYICGNVEKAIYSIYKLIPSATVSDNSDIFLFSDLLKCFTISDKCVFWVCCIYFVFYRKLPREIVQQLEFGKELPVIDWPSVDLRVDDKQQAIKLIDVAADSVASYTDGQSVGPVPTCRPVTMFAVNQIRCTTALNGLRFGWNLLEKYIKLYPSCVELILMSARAQQHKSGDLSFVGFEEALNNWPKEVPGVQCIWNQFVEYALQNGRFDSAKELMVRWFHTVWKVQDGHSNAMVCDDGDNLRVSRESPSASMADGSVSSSSQFDEMFGLLNLSLYRLLENDYTEARVAIDRALKVAAPEDFRHCVREHAMFLLTDGTQVKKDAPRDGMLNILKGYMIDPRAFQASVPLSRKFLQDIKKPRVQQLVNNMLGPISLDVSLVNSCLEVWYGPSLLPKQFDNNNLKELVDLVEAIMEISPSNYHLAISLCKLLTTAPECSAPVPANVLFWASSLLVNAIFQAVPVASEFVWVEVAGILSNLTDMQVISENFYRSALSIYPFSIRLWRSYHSLSKIWGNSTDIVEAANERGIRLE